MPTSKPLKDMRSELTRHILNHQQYLQFNDRLFLVHEGQLRKEIEDSLRKELSPTAFQKAIQRVPSINLLVRIIDKLSRVYSQPVERTTISPSDQELIEQYETASCISSKLASANKMYNLHKSAAIEGFFQDGQLQLRVQPANKFLMYSDDLVNPMRPTVYIKFMDLTRNLPFTDRDGQKTVTDEVRQVQAYYLWSDTEFMIVDSEGAFREDLMTERELSGVNPLGRLPAAYINRSDFLLIPIPDTDTLENTVLIPKLLADLNYAVSYQSHSILIATDLNLPADLAMNPDSVWNLTSAEDDKHGKFEAISPKVDIESVIGLIKTTLAIWLESRNIQAGDMGQMSPGDAASGLARIIDESDATQDRQAQCIRFQDVERDVWSLISAMHNYGAASDLLDEKKLFSEDLNVTVRFGDQKPMVTDKENVDVIVTKRMNGLITLERAVRELYPTWSDDEVEAEVEALNLEPKIQPGSTIQSPVGSTNGSGAPASSGGSPQGYDSAASPGTGSGG